MKHEYLTCDRCGNKIQQKLPLCSGALNLQVRYVKPYSLNLENEMLRLKQEIDNMTLDYSIDVDIALDFKSSSFDLCHKCGKELKLFLQGKEKLT